jgi:hypothetical protein
MSQVLSSVVAAAAGGGPWRALPSATVLPLLERHKEGAR